MRPLRRTGLAADRHPDRGALTLLVGACAVAPRGRARCASPPRSRRSGRRSTSTIRTRWRWPCRTPPSHTRCAATSPAWNGCLTDLTAVCDRYEFAYYREWATVLTGWLRGGGAGLAQARRGIDALEREGSLARMPYWLWLVADLHRQSGDAAAALGALDAAHTVATQNSDVWWLPEVLRARAAISHRARAVVDLERGTALAAQQGSLTLEERCSGDLVRLRSFGAFRGHPAERNAPGTPASLGSGEHLHRTQTEEPLMTTTTTPITGAGALAEVPFEDLAATLRGSLVRPGDPEFDEARAVYNAMIDRSPAAVARCRDTADVVACVRFAAQHNIAPAIRGGGHNAAGLGTWDDALVIDLSPMHSVTVDPSTQTVRVDGGCTWADVDHASVPFGLAVPFGLPRQHRGRWAHVGRRDGLPHPPVRPDDRQPARRRRGARRRHPGARGRRAEPGPVLGPARRRRQLRRGHLVHVPGQPDRRQRNHLRWPGALRPGRHRLGDAVVPRAVAEPARGAQRLDRNDDDPSGSAVPGRALGTQGLRHRVVLHRSLDQAEEVTAPVREFGTPLVVGMHEMPFNVLQGAFDALYPAGLQWYWRADFCPEISDEAIAVHEKYAATLPTGHSTMHMYPIGGAAARVSPDETAWPHRQGGWSSVIVGVDPDPANAELITTGRGSTRRSSTRPRRRRRTST